MECVVLRGEPVGDVQLWVLVEAFQGEPERPGLRDTGAEGGYEVEEPTNRSDHLGRLLGRSANLFQFRLRCVGRATKPAEWILRSFKPVANDRLKHAALPVLRFLTRGRLHEEVGRFIHCSYPGEAVAADEVVIEE